MKRQQRSLARPPPIAAAAAAALPPPPAVAPSAPFPAPCSSRHTAATMASSEELLELLIDGARYGDADDVHKALEGKVDVNAADEWGKTGGDSSSFEHGRGTVRQGDSVLTLLVLPTGAATPLQHCTWHLLTGMPTS